MALPHGCPFADQPPGFFLGSAQLAACEKSWRSTSWPLNQYPLSSTIEKAGPCGHKGYIPWGNCDQVNEILFTPAPLCSLTLPLRLPLPLHLPRPLPSTLRLFPSPSLSLPRQFLNEHSISFFMLQSLFLIPVLSFTVTAASFGKHAHQHTPRCLLIACYGSRFYTPQPVRLLSRLLLSMPRAI